MSYHHQLDYLFHKAPYYWSFVRGIHRSPVDSSHKGPVMLKASPWHNAVMILIVLTTCIIHVLSSLSSKILLLVPIFVPIVNENVIITAISAAPHKITYSTPIHINTCYIISRILIRLNWDHQLFIRPSQFSQVLGMANSPNFYFWYWNCRCSCTSCVHRSQDTHPFTRQPPIRLPQPTPSIPHISEYMSRFRNLPCSTPAVCRRYAAV